VTERKSDASRQTTLLHAGSDDTAEAEAIITCKINKLNATTTIYFTTYSIGLLSFNQPAYSELSQLVQ